MLKHVVKTLQILRNVVTVTPLSCNSQAEPLHGNTLFNTFQWNPLCNAWPYLNSS